MSAVEADSKSSDTVWFVRLHSDPEKQQLILLMVMAKTFPKDKHTYVPMMRSKKQAEIHRSTR